MDPAAGSSVSREVAILSLARNAIHAARSVELASGS